MFNATDDLAFLTYFSEPETEPWRDRQVPPWWVVGVTASKMADRSELIHRPPRGGLAAPPHYSRGIEIPRLTQWTYPHVILGNDICIRGIQHEHHNG